MILVADSGSTKSDWVIVSNNQEKTLTHTVGFNPIFHSSNFIFDNIANNEVLTRFSEEITHVYFYGAGCSNQERIAIVSLALNRFFPNLQTCKVDHDLLAACIATAGDEAGIPCILGTGSNSCFYDGTQIVSNIPALGYVLGDEGSGSYFGKIMLRDWLYKRMPAALQSNFDSTYRLDKDTIFNAVYSEANPNVYLAGFMTFASENRDHPYIQSMIFNGLKDFAKYHILCYENYQHVPVHFIGSIAYYFRETLEKLAAELGFSIGVVERKPALHIADFHIAH